MMQAWIIFLDLEADKIEKQQKKLRKKLKRRRK